jgi:hypothetical protein
MMIGRTETVNGAEARPRTTDENVINQKKINQKKAGLARARLRYWPPEADTITFQERLLLSFRAAGGGGQMRNVNAQRESIMSCVGAVRQPSTPHVSHAETGGGQVFPIQNSRPSCAGRIAFKTARERL